MAPQPQPQPERPDDTVQPRPATAAEAAPVTITAEPQLRDLQKELLGLVPASLRRKQAAKKKADALPKAARPSINATPDVYEEQQYEAAE